MTGASGYAWREGDNFAELARLGAEWEISYGFEATATSGRIIVARRTTPDYEDAVRQLRQVIGYYFAEPEHAERVRRELLERAGIDPGPSQYLPVPDNKALTAAGGGAGADDQVTADNERRTRILRGEPLPEPDAATPPEGGATARVPAIEETAKPGKRPWWKRFRS